MTPVEILANRFHLEANQHAETHARLLAKEAELTALQRRIDELEAQQSPTPPHVETPRGPAMETR